MWPEYAKKALFGQPDLTEPCKALQLLIDAEPVFRGIEDGIHTATLIDRLSDIDDSIWKDYNFRQRDEDRQRITSRQISGLLRRYKIKPGQIKIGGVNRHGYRRDPIKKAVKRYTNPLTSITPPEINATTLLPTVGAASGDSYPLPSKTVGSVKKTLKPTDGAGGSVVADKTGGATGNQRSNTNRKLF